MTDYKQLCAELLSELENVIRVIYREDGTWHISSADPVIAKADAALAEPDPEGPTDEELDELAWNWYSKTGSTWYQIAAFRAFARAALARWGRSDGPAVPDGREPASVNAEPSDAIPADGEVAELANSLRHSGDALRVYGLHGGADDCQRAADLLERLASPACLVVNPPPEAVQALKAAGPGRIELMPADPPQPVPVLPPGAQVIEPSERTLLVPVAQPVPVSERLPGAELCWWYEPDEDDDGSGYGGSWTLLRIRGNTVSYTHWLPAHALPVPTSDQH